MESENVKTSQGILLIRTKSGTTKLERVVVQAKRGKRKNQVKWLQKYVTEKKKASKIPVFVRNYRRGIRRKRIRKSLDGSEASRVKKYENLNEEEKKNLMRIINLDKLKSKKSLQEHFDSGIMSLSQTITSELQTDIPDKKSTKSGMSEETESSKTSSTDFSETKSSPKKDSVSEETESSTRKTLSSDFSKTNSKQESEETEASTNQTLSTDFSGIKQDASMILLEETETQKDIFFAQNYTIQFPLSDDDDDNRFAHPQRQRTSIVMAQYETTTPNTFHETEEDIGDDSGDEDIRLYIDSGLRPLKSDESKLYLDPESHQGKKHHTTSDDDDIDPLLEDIPSDIFEDWDHRKKKPKEKVKQPSPPSNRGDFTSSEEKSISSQLSNQIDTDPLKKLQEFEDVKFTIETDVKVEDAELEEEDKKEEKSEQDDFCVHVEDVPDGDFSSSTADDSKTKIDAKEEEVECLCPEDVDVKTKKSDICVHTSDPPGKDSFSTDGSGLSIGPAPFQSRIPKKQVRLSDSRSVKSASSSLLSTNKETKEYK
ncbi:uncharacterized protein LOC135131763 [Zophobas morio]|uniref:uncharacterized protein LOC135131763 n=1 Tax=Zophobas morio TaxID=2755281 RepID=UPI003082ABCB